jgi:hypothetical protein
VPKASKETASERQVVEGYEGALEHFDGGWTVAFETYTQDADLAPLMVDLPAGQCQAVHIGYVIKGRLAYRTSAGEEVYEAGDAYYIGPGHTPVLYAGTEIVEFSPTEELKRTMAAVTERARGLAEGQ